MNREILFRGKRIDNGEWAEGSYINSYGSHILVFGYEYASNTAQFRVHPETVFQFAGLLDKNGRKIFDGDILKLTYDGYSFNCDVKFKEGAFLVESNNSFNGGDADLTTVGWLKHDDYSYEVIGNIYDNPELIEKQDA